MDVLTQHNNNFRTGSVQIPGFNAESDSLRRWALLNELPVDGAVYAQPLYVEGLHIGGAVRDVTVIATAMNTVYAFDVRTFTLLWRHHFGPPDASDQQLPYSDPRLGCGTLSPGRVEDGRPQYFIGIQSTPVIGRLPDRIYVSYRLGGRTRFDAVQRLAALNLVDGTVHEDVPTGQAPGFRIENQRQRASLLLVDQLVFLAFGSRCEDPRNDNDDKRYHGWLFAHEATGLRQVGDYNVTQTSVGGGIWQASTGPAADERGRVYLITGNIQVDKADPQVDPADPSPDPHGVNLGNSFVRVDPDITWSPRDSAAPLRPPRVDSVRLAPGDWFTPYRARWQNEIDLDLGSAGALLLPGTNLVVGGGKEGVLYLLNRDHLGRWTRPPESALPPHCADQKQGPHYCSPFIPNRKLYDQGAVDELRIAQNTYISNLDMNNWPTWPHIHGSPVYGEFGDGFRLLFVWPEKDYLKSVLLQLKSAGGRLKKWGRGPDRAPEGGMPGGMLALVVDPTTPGAGLLFASVPLEKQIEGLAGLLHGSLRAYNPMTLGRVWTSHETSNKSYFFAKFVGPTVVPGALLLPTFSNKVLLYGILSFAPPGITGLKRDAAQEDIFCVGTNGVVYTNFVVDRGPWNGWIPLIDYSDVFPDHFTVPPEAVLAAIKRDAHHEEIFVVGRDGAVYTSSVRDDGPWNGWDRIEDLSYGDGFKVQPGSPITAIKRDDRQVDIFVVGREQTVGQRDSPVFTNWMDPEADPEHPHWSRWLRLEDPRYRDHFTVPPRSPITAIKRDSHHEDIFVVGRDGAVFTNWVRDDGPWNGWDRIEDLSYGDGFKVQPGSPITAIKRDDRQVDIFVVGRDGAVFTNWMDPEADPEHPHWNRWILLA
jgi:hypothetical protein